MNDDFYNSGVPSNILEENNAHIEARWKELSEFYLRFVDEMIKYLLYVNAGGAAISLGFMGASDMARNSIWLKIALCFFALGLVFVGILRATLVHKIKNLFDSWRGDCEKYWNQKIGFTKLTQADENRSESDLYAFVLGYISGAAFILGLICGGISLFSH